MVIDFHTHIFPDAIAEKTIRFLGEKASIRAKTDGTAAGLLHSMEEGGTDLSVILPVLTKPSQFRSILSFAERLNKTYPQRLFSFGGIHPDSEQYKQELRQIRDAGLLGVKLSLIHIFIEGRSHGASLKKKQIVLPICCCREGYIKEKKLQF